MIPKIKIVESDVMDWLANYEGDKFHAVCSDPPYGLAFMGRDFDTFASSLEYQQWCEGWARLMIGNVLYPGAVGLFFGGRRTEHRLGVGLEDGGFEIFDKVDWVYASGFPKSYSVSKGIDRKLGENREKIPIGSPVKRMIPGSDQHKTGSWIKDNGRIYQPGIELPSSPEAQLWDGYGTALKPSIEGIYCVRAPRLGKTFVELALEYGTGSLWIDGGRIGVSQQDREQFKRLGGFNNTQSIGTEKGIYGGGEIIDRDGWDTTGRWPANLILAHSLNCKLVGTESDSYTINRFTDGSKPFGDGAGHPYRGEKRQGEIEIWECEDGCAVRMLGEQGGNLKSGKSAPDGHRRNLGVAENHTIYGGGKGLWNNSQTQNAGDLYGDQGTASRFFYSAKTSPSERNAGCENFFWKRNPNSPIGFARVPKSEYDKLPANQRADGNIHPTLKPIDLIRYLTTLILPPKLNEPRRLLIPFGGAGSEVMGAILAGWEEITMIEYSPEYCDLAEARIINQIGPMFASMIERNKP